MLMYFSLTVTAYTNQRANTVSRVIGKKATLRCINHANNCSRH